MPLSLVLTKLQPCRLACGSSVRLRSKLVRLYEQAWSMLIARPESVETLGLKYA